MEKRRLKTTLEVVYQPRIRKPRLKIFALSSFTHKKIPFIQSWLESRPCDYILAHQIRIVRFSSLTLSTYTETEQERKKTIMKKCIIMFIFLLITIFIAIVTERTQEIQVDEMLVANDAVSTELLTINELKK